MHSFYIGPAGNRLYCNLHEPDVPLVRESAVLLCPAIGHEYYRSYRSQVRLAEHLANHGFAVLRFDYRGTGDSEGDQGTALMADCVDDAVQAAEALRADNPGRRIVLGGIRFGSQVATLAAKRVANAAALLFWDPVLDGEAYVAQLEALHREMLRDMERFPRPRAKTEGHEHELVGHCYGDGLLRDIAAFDLGAVIEPGLNAAAVTGRDDLRRFIPDAAVERLHPRVLPHSGYGWGDPGRIWETIVDPIATRELTNLLDEVTA